MFYNHLLLHLHPIMMLLLHLLLQLLLNNLLQLVPTATFRFSVH
jgi:hypothetical protein